MDKIKDEKKIGTYGSCPHCGRVLSPWEQVLLSVDRALMCKNCWYRINLEPLDVTPGKHGKDQSKKKV